jgi:hypothetical protein
MTIRRSRRPRLHKLSQQVFRFHKVRSGCSISIRRRRRRRRIQRRMIVM